MNLTILVVLSAGLLVALLIAVVVPASTAKGWAVLTTLISGAVFINPSAPTHFWAPVSIGCIVLLAIGVYRGGLSARWRGGTILLLIWMAYAVIGGLIAAALPLLNVALYFALLALLVVVTTALSKAEIRLVLRGFLALATVQVIIAGAEFLVDLAPLWGYRGGLLRENPFIEGAVRAQGTFGHPIVMGYFMAVVGLIAWNGRAAGLSRNPRIALLLMAAAGAVLSGTRSAVLATVVGILVHTLMRSNMSAWLRNTALFASLGIVVYFQSSSLSRIVSELLDSGSWSHRMNSLGAIGNLLSRETGETLWGSGWGTEISLYDRGLIPMSFGLKVIDNFVVYLLGTMGVIGFALLVVACVVIFIRADSLGRGLVIVSATMFFSFDLVTWYFAGILMMFTLALPRTSSGKDLRSRRPRSRRPAARSLAAEVSRV